MSKIYAMLFRLSDPRKVALLFGLLLFASTLAGCNIVPASPLGGSGGGGCGGGGL